MAGCCLPFRTVYSGGLPLNVQNGVQRWTASDRSNGVQWWVTSERSNGVQWWVTSKRSNGVQWWAALRARSVRGIFVTTANI